MQENKLKNFFERFLENRLYKDLFLIALGVLLLTAGMIFFRMRYCELREWELLRHACSEEEIQNILRKASSQKIKDVAVMKLAELLMSAKQFDKARYYQDILRKTAGQQELRFRAASDYAISLFFSRKYKEAIAALKEIQTYGGPVPAEKRFSILMLLATASFRCGENLSGQKYLLEIISLPHSVDPQNKEIRQKAYTLLKHLEKGRRK